MSNEQRRIGDVIVERVRIIGTRRDVYSAWDAIYCTREIEYGTIEHFDDARSVTGRLLHGKIGTKYPPVEIQDPPGHDARVPAITAWIQSDQLRAVAYVLAAFPELSQRMYSVIDGQVVVEGEY